MQQPLEGRRDLKPKQEKEGHNEGGKRSKSSLPHHFQTHAALYTEQRREGGQEKEQKARLGGVQGEKSIAL